MKIAVSTYSFWQMMSKGEITQIGCIKQAKELGFDAVELESIRPHDGRSEKEYAYALAEEAKKQGIPLSQLTFGAELLQTDETAFRKEIERVKGMIDLADILGVSSIRHDATRGYEREGRLQKGFDQALPDLIRGCKEITEYAEKKGIRTTVENHGVFCQDSLRIEKLVTGVGHSNFGVLADMGNFLCVDEEPVQAFSLLAPYVYYAHVKDFHVKSGMGPDPGKGFFKSRGSNYLRGAIIGHGNVPIMQCLNILKQVGYTGYLGVEFEGLEHPLLGLEIGLKNLRNYLERLA